jgi:D-cysteine desulfhydrase
MMPDPKRLTHKIRERLRARSLGARPTPLAAASGALTRAVALDALWLKREDAIGGNKVRSLEFLLATVHPGDVVLTIGGTGSTHCLATAIHARALGCRVALAQFPQPDTDTAVTTAAVTATYADILRRSRTLAGFPLALLSAWLAARRQGRVVRVPGGGASASGVVGQLLAGLELADQMSEPPDAIMTPLGSGGTAAGLALAMATLGWPTQVVAVRVAPRIIANRWRTARLAGAARHLLAHYDIPLTPHRSLLTPLIIDALGRGYGYPTSAGESARALAAEHGLVLDSTYGAKAFAALPECARRGFRRVVFWHTFARPTIPESAA